MKMSIHPMTPAVPALALAGILALAGCARDDADKTAAGMPVLVARAGVTNVPVRIEPPPVGHVLPMASITVRPQIGGIIRKIHFQEGQEVRRGDRLFTIDPRPSQAALAAARAALARDTAQMQNAKIQFEREQKLLDQKLVSQDDFDTSKAALDALTGTVAADESAVTNAALNLEFTEIRAPFDGRTGGLQFHEGNVVKAPDDILLTIHQIHPIYVQFGVPEQYLPVIRREMRGQTLKAAATFPNLEGPAPQGDLTFIDNSVDPTTGMIQLRATFPNERGELWPGQFVNVTLTLSELTNVVVVPSQAVQTGQNGQYLYVVRSDPAHPTVEERPIVTGLTFQGLTVVANGLAAGELVVTDGQLRLTPDARVAIQSAGASTNAP